MRRAAPRSLGWILSASASVLAVGGAVLLLARADVVVEGTGVLRPRGGVLKLASEADGRVAAATAQVGQVVKEGGTLLLLEDADLRRQFQAMDDLLRAETAQLETVQAMRRLASAQRDASSGARALEVASQEETLRLTRELVSEGLEPEAELQRQRTRLEVARQELAVEEMAGALRLRDLEARRSGHQRSVDELRERLALVERDMDKRRIRAPVDGQLTWMGPRNAGEWVAAGATVAHIVPAAGELVVECRVPNRAIGSVRVGQVARLEFDAFPRTRYGHLDGEVVHVAPDAADEQGIYYVLVGLARREAGGALREMLKLGMTARVSIVTGRHRLVTTLFEE